MPKKTLPHEPKPLEELEAKLGYVFHDKKLLEDALTIGHKQLPFQRMEFLGDSVWKVVVTTVAERAIRDSGLSDRLGKGALGKICNRWVSNRNLALIARRLDLDDYMRTASIGIADEYTRRNHRADVLEAVFGAMFKDAGANLSPIEHFLESYIQQQQLDIIQRVRNDAGPERG